MILRLSRGQNFDPDSEAEASKKIGLDILTLASVSRSKFWSRPRLQSPGRCQTLGLKGDQS